MTVIQRIVVTAVLWNLCVLRAFAQAPSPQEAFDQLVAAHSAIAGENAEVQRTELVAHWVESNDWQPLSLKDKAWLHAQLLALDQVDRTSFSVRWTGSIVAPATREYVFRQHCLPGAYGGTLKLWINSQLVLDTTATPQRLGIGPQLAPPAEGAYRSQAVNLVAGEAVSFQVDYVYHDEFSEFVDASHQWRFPLPLLLWEAKGVEPQIVPRSVFAPPVDFETEEVSGLQAEYFNDPEFSASVGAFWEPGVQAIWNKRPVLPRYKHAQEDILAAIRDQIVSPVGVADGEAAAYVQQAFGGALPGLSSADRQMAIESMAAEASLLPHLTPAVVSSWMPHISAIPKPVSIELLTSWSEFFEVPPSRMAVSGGLGPNSYAAANYKNYRAIGLWLNGPQWPLAEQLVAEHLKNENGACNLLIAYITSFSARYEHSPRLVLEPITESLNDESLSPDVRASWLVARGFASELYIGGLPKPSLALPYMQEAMLTTEGSELRFKLLQEIVSRLASTAQTAEALSFLDAHAVEFQDPSQQATVGELRNRISELAEHFESERTAGVQRQADRARETHLAILQRRRDAAMAREDNDAAGVYQQRIDEEESDSP